MDCIVTVTGGDYGLGPMTMVPLGLSSLPIDVLFIISSSLDLISFVSLTLTNLHLRKELHQDRMWKERYALSFRTLWGDTTTMMRQDYCHNNNRDWYKQVKRAYQKRKSIAVIYAYSRMYEHSQFAGAYLIRTSSMLSTYGFKVVPIELHQPDFNEEKLNSIKTDLEKVSAILYFSNGYFKEDEVWDSLVVP